jgi:hypothetical protein bacD2_23304|nr:MAG TPA: ASCH domain protein [Caudoviricetes sp.]
MRAMMFNDHFCLTEAVIENRKLQTRRIERGLELLSETNHEFDGNKVILYFEASDEPIIIRPRYKVGEIVAVAQSYDSAGISTTHKIYNDKNGQYENACDTAGWTNKMFVKPELLPHQIQITNIGLERLQDISDEDCIKEGIIKFGDRFDGNFGFYENKRGKFPHLFESERSAFAWLIDRVGGKGTWASNPYVFAYEFRLVR